MRTALGVTLIIISTCGAALAQQTPSPASEEPKGQNAAQSASPETMPQAPPQRLASEVTGIARFSGLRVRSIDIVGAEVEEERLQELIQQQLDKPLDKENIRRTIRALYGTGRFSDIQVDAQRDGGSQVRLVFHASENRFLGIITLEGAPSKAPAPNQIVNSTRLELGELYTEEKVRGAAQSILDILREHGYYLAKVDWRTQLRPQTNLIDVHYVIHTGDIARVGKVIIQGEAGIPEAELGDISDLDPGDKVTQERVRKALTKLRQEYQERGRLEAQVSLVDRVFHAGSNTVDFVFRIRQGPTVDVHIQGADLRKGRIRRYVPIYEEHTVDEDLLNEGRRNLRDYFQTRGYFDVDVNFREEFVPEKDHRHIIYDVELGEEHKLVDLQFEGNKIFDDYTLLERMVIQPATLLLASGRFSDSMLQRDLDAIEDLYRSNGYQDVKVESEVQEDVEGKHGQMRVVIRVTEGEPTLVQLLEFSGNKTFPESEFRSIIDTSQGQPYSEYNISVDRDRILNYYFNRGFPNARFEFTVQPVEGQPKRVHLTYKIDEGERVFVDRVLISGLENTHRFVVDRELKIQEGQPLSLADVYETQRRLYDLGIFNQVRVAVENPEGHAAEKNVILHFEEAKRYTFSYGFGVEIATGSDPGSRLDPQGRTGVSPRVSFDVTRMNFLGRDHTLVFKSRLGRLQQRALFSYEAPRFRGREDMRVNFTTFYDTTRDVRTFTAERLEGSIQLEHKTSLSESLLYRFSYRRVDVDAATLVVDPGLIPLLSRPVRVGMPSITYVRDRRDDPLDATRGAYTVGDFGVSSNIFGSESGFSKFLMQNATYHSFTFGDSRRRFVFARSLRLGFENPFGGDLIPLPERFFAGGATSHRGFGINQAGPRDRETGFPLGGAAMLVNNLELRMPPFLLPFVEDNLSAVVFHDMGNVFSSAKEMARGIFRHSQRSAEACKFLTVNARCDFDYISHAVGAGLRYRTPIGPVRVDFGYNLNPPTFPVRRETRSDTLNRFNFYFSIGQTF